MAKHKLRIVIKDLPKDMLISEAEKKKIIGGAIFHATNYMNAARITPCPSSPYIDYICKRS
jgi:hypothetical protein